MKNNQENGTKYKATKVIFEKRGVIPSGTGTGTGFQLEWIEESMKPEGLGALRNGYPRNCVTDIIDDVATGRRSYTEGAILLRGNVISIKLNT